MDAQAAERGFLLAELASLGGPALAFQLRDPSLHGRAIYDAAVTLRSRIGSGASFLVNDRVDVALAVGADGVHLKASSLPPHDVRGIVGSHFLVGRSVHDLTEVDRWAGAAPSSADYLVLGSVAPTASHPGRPPLPTDSVRLAPARSCVPVLAIGGVTPDGLSDLCALGYHGAAVLSGIWGATDPLEALSAYLQVLSRHRSSWNRDGDD
ncbi:MAG: thiamine phosphate synthase [Gemmatimonadetes bacterium]|nr:thiamine phosphate synthase [Gemmatimonadota bacterium]